jgi:proteic killer suppression protein
MIRGFRHRGLERFFRTGSVSGINAAWARRLQVRLDALNVASLPSDVDIPGWGLHQLKADREGTWSLRVTGNLRLTFQIENGDVWDVNLEDYH